MMEPLKRETRVGKYIVRSQLGKGGMGTVYRVRHSEMPKLEAAIKVLQHDDSAMKARFRREIKILSQVKSKHIVTILDLGEHEGQPYYVMELLQGNDLHEEIATAPNRRLSYERVADIALGVCTGLSNAAEEGVYHRDIKPANIFLHRTANEEVVKLVDFGIALLAFGQEITEVDKVAGTRAYLSPEQLRKGAVYGTTDQFALAVTLYVALSGRFPWSPDDLMRQMAGPYVHISELREDLPKEFAAALMKALSIHHEERFSIIQEFGEALAPFASQSHRVAFDTSLKANVDNFPMRMQAADSMAVPIFKKHKQLVRTTNVRETISKAGSQAITRSAQTKVEPPDPNDLASIRGETNTTAKDALPIELDETLLDPDAAAKVLASIHASAGAAAGSIAVEAGGTKVLSRAGLERFTRGSRRIRKLRKRTQRILAAVAGASLLTSVAMVVFFVLRQSAPEPRFAPLSPAQKSEVKQLAPPAPPVVAKTPTGPVPASNVEAAAPPPAASPAPVVTRPAPLEDVSAAAATAPDVVAAPRPTKKKPARKIVYAPGGSVILPP